MSKPRSKKSAPSKPLFHNRQWQQCYDDWLRNIFQRSGSKESEKTYRNLTRAFFDDPARTPDQYSRADVETFVRRDGSARTQNNRLTALRSFYAFAAQYDVPFRRSVRPILHTPTPTRGMRAIKPGRKRRDLTVDELKQLFAAIPRETVKDKRDYALFSFYWWTARRRAEIVRLTWGDIFEVVFMESSGPRTGHMYRYSTKGHSRETFTAELRPEAWNALIDYLQASERLEQMQPDSPLFTRLDNGRLRWEPDQPLHPDSIGAILAPYVKQAGLDELALEGRQVCTHSFRHTRARAQYRREHDIMEIKRLLGHASVGSTQIYLIDAEDKPDTGAAMLAAELGKL